MVKVCLFLLSHFKKLKSRIRLSPKLKASFTALVKAGNRLQGSLILFLTKYMFYDIIYSMRKSFMLKGSVSKVIIYMLATVGIVATPVVGGIIGRAIEDQRWSRICDGVNIVEICQDDSGTKYKKYLLHAAEPEKTKQVHHEAEPEKSHIVKHDAVYGTRQVRGDCIRTNISYKHGTCALSRCRDGMYSGSTGWGTCNYHGGVAVTGGPWYQYTTESYVITPAWEEKIVDVPAKPAWTETVVVSPAKAEWIEKIVEK